MTDEQKAAAKAERDEMIAATRAHSDAFTEALRIEYEAELRRREIAAYEASEEATQHADDIAAAIEGGYL